MEKIVLKEKIDHPVLGEITINRSPRARRLTLSVRPSGATLTLPPKYPLDKALAFAESKQAWLEKARIRAQKRQAPPPVILPPFQTRMYTLVLIPSDNTAIRLRIGQGALQIGYPRNLSPESEPVQQAIRKGISEVYRAEAKSLLPERVKALASRYGFRYAGLAFRDATTRWGSCSGRNSLSLSIHLMALPDHLIDYVILHELCHTKHKNHGPEFHALLDKVCGGRHPEWNKQLRSYAIRR